MWTLIGDPIVGYTLIQPDGVRSDWTFALIDDAIKTRDGINRGEIVPAAVTHHAVA